MPRSLNNSRYALWSHAPGGVRIYALRCCLCGERSERGLPDRVSTGLYFRYPIQCANCKRWSVHYNRGVKIDHVES